MGNIENNKEFPVNAKESHEGNKYNPEKKEFKDKDAEEKSKADEILKKAENLRDTKLDKDAGKGWWWTKTTKKKDLIFKKRESEFQQRMQNHPQRPTQEIYWAAMNILDTITWSDKAEEKPVARLIWKIMKLILNS